MTRHPREAFQRFLKEVKPGDYTFAVLKPDAFVRGLTREITDLIVDAGLEVRHAEDGTLDDSDVTALYYEHVGKEFYQRNAMFMTSGPSRLMLLVGPGAQKVWREVLMPEIRDQWMLPSLNQEANRCRNLVHGSDSIPAAFREVHYFFF